MNDAEDFERKKKALLEAIASAERWARLVTVWLILLTIGFFWLVLR